MNLARIQTPLGTFRAYFSAHGLARLEFPSARAASRNKTRRLPPSNSKTQAPDFQPAGLHVWQAVTAKALGAALSGHAPKAWPPLDWSGGTDFQRRVWAALQRIPPGQTRTYAQLAATLGQPRAARAVGGACGANPIPVLVPCHRVTAASGGLGGFSGGLAWKRRLLAIEGVNLRRARKLR